MMGSKIFAFRGLHKFSGFGGLHKLCVGFRSLSSSSSFLYDRRNFSDEYIDRVMNNNKDTDTSPLLVNYGNGFLQMLTFSSEFIRKQAVSVQFPNNYIVCGPCHGLFCLYSVKGEIALWNPATGDLKNLPPDLPSCSDQEEVKVENVAFGFDSTANDYKIVRHITRSHFHNNFVEKILHEIQIYSLKTKKWREITVLGEILSHLPSLFPGSYADGACYWTIPADSLLHGGGDDYETRLISFVFAEEEFHIQSLPSPVPWKHMSCLMDTLNGFPAAICYHPYQYYGNYYGDSLDDSYNPERETTYGLGHNQYFHVWACMRDNGVLTWVYQMEIGPFNHIGFTPLCFWRNEGLIMFDSRFNLVLYDFHTNNVISSGLYVLGAKQRRKRNREISMYTFQVLNFPEILVCNPW